MKLIALFGLIAGAILALGNLTAAQWQAVGTGLLALVVRYGLTVLPWVLAALFAWLWWRERRTSNEFEGIAVDALRSAHRSIAFVEQARPAPSKRRKRGAR